MMSMGWVQDFSYKVWKLTLAISFWTYIFPWRTESCGRMKCSESKTSRDSSLMQMMLFLRMLFIAFLKPCASHPSAKRPLMCMAEMSRAKTMPNNSIWQPGNELRVLICICTKWDSSQHIKDNDYQVCHSLVSYNSGLIQDGKQWIDIDCWSNTIDHQVDR